MDDELHDLPERAAGADTGAEAQPLPVSAPDPAGETAVAAAPSDAGMSEQMPDAGQRQKDRGFLAALLFFIGAITLGTLITSLPLMTARDWYFWVGLRILVQAGGGLWFGYAMARTMGLNRWQIAGVFMLFGAFISLNALIDGVQGPQLVEGTIESFDTESNYLHDRFGWPIGLRAEVELSRSDGSNVVLMPSGAQVANLAETIRRCRELDQPIQFRMLMRLDIILGAHCFVSI